MTKDDLLALAERCEKATGPDRELDCAILAAIDWREPDWEEGERTVREMVARRGLSAFAKSADEGMSIWRHLPRPTASLDAAMSLVPEGWLMMLSDWQSAKLREIGAWQALLSRDRDALTDTFAARCDHAATPALALCAAALRARANQEPNNG